jgi:hypothetical protein
MTIGLLTPVVKFATVFNDTDGQFGAAAVNTGGAPCNAKNLEK